MYYIDSIFEDRQGSAQLTLRIDIVINSPGNFLPFLPFLLFGGCEWKVEKYVNSGQCRNSISKLKTYPM